MAEVGDVKIDKVGEPVPLTVLGERKDLSKQGAAEVSRLMRREPWPFLAKMVETWALIGVAIGLALYANHWLVSLLAILFIGTRQNVLGLLLHEQVHRIAFRSPFGEYLTNFFAAYPLGLTLEGYRRVHLNHHQHFFTERDPDFARKQGREWTFPQRAGRFWLTMVRDLLALNLWNTIRSKTMESQQSGSGRRSVGTPALVRVAYYLVIAGVLTYFGWWTSFLLYWVLPWATVLQAAVRWAAICEHKYNLVHPTVAEATPFIHLRWWEQLLLPNLYFTTYHVYHHYYPKVPWRKLPKVHEIYLREGLVNQDHIFYGFGSYLRYLRKGKAPTARSG